MNSLFCFPILIKSNIESEKCDLFEIQKITPEIRYKLFGLKDCEFNQDHLLIKSIQNTLDFFPLREYCFVYIPSYINNLSSSNYIILINEEYAKHFNTAILLLALGNSGLSIGAKACNLENQATYGPSTAFIHNKPTWIALQNHVLNRDEIALLEKILQKITELSPTIYEIIDDFTESFKDKKDEDKMIMFCSILERIYNPKQAKGKSTAEPIIIELQTNFPDLPKAVPTAIRNAYSKYRKKIHKIIYDSVPQTEVYLVADICRKAILKKLI